MLYQWKRTFQKRRMMTYGRMALMKRKREN
ncbi:MAG: hypothetical protein ACHQYP_07665 [Nitrospiria bacterium]